MIYKYDYYCNELIPSIDPIGDVPTSDLPFKHNNLIFQSQLDGNIKAYNLSGGAVVTIHCVAPPFNDTSMGGFLGLANYFLDCNANALTVLNNQNQLFIIDMDLDIQTELALDLSGVAPGFQVQGTAYNNLCNNTEYQNYTHINCESPVENLANEIHISMFPNPVKDMLSIQTAINILEIEIYDIQGRLCAKLKRPGSSIKLDKLAPGLYVLNIETESGKFVRKLIKE